MSGDDRDVEAAREVRRLRLIAAVPPLLAAHILAALGVGTLTRQETTA